MDAIAIDTISARLTKGELSAVTFVRDYVQFQFEGPIINSYVWPRVRASGKEFVYEAVGYRDALCAQIGKAVVTIRELPNEKLSVVFSDGATIDISLKDEDKRSAESAMFQDGTGQLWTVWN